MKCYINSHLVEAPRKQSGEGEDMQSLYISRVKIKNFRNFKDVDVNLGHKEVIIGENNVGKPIF